VARSTATKGPTASAVAGEGGGARAVLLLMPAVFGCVVLAAHFLRRFDLVEAGLCLLLPLVLFVRRAWVARLMQVVMAFATISWLGTLSLLVDERWAAGLPWMRLVAILAGVAVVTLAGAALFESRTLRRRYGLRTADVFRSAPPAAGDR
jgi:hypothetical protein